MEVDYKQACASWACELAANSNPSGSTAKKFGMSARLGRRKLIGQGWLGQWGANFGGQWGANYQMKGHKKQAALAALA